MYYFLSVGIKRSAVLNSQAARKSTVVRQLAPRAWCPLQCLLAETGGILSPGVGRSEECAQEFAPQSHVHSGLNQQDLISSDVFVVKFDINKKRRKFFTCFALFPSTVSQAVKSHIHTHTHSDVLSPLSSSLPALSALSAQLFTPFCPSHVFSPVNRSSHQSP